MRVLEQAIGLRGQLLCGIFNPIALSHLTHLTVYPMTDLDLFDYRLPERLIAAVPADRRDQSRLLRLERASGTVSHHKFSDLRLLLRAGDVLVINDARVIPARLQARRTTGGKVEVLLVTPQQTPDGKPADPPTWLVMLEAGGTLRPGEQLALEDADASLRLVENRGRGLWLVRLEGEGATMERVLQAGQMPLPHYVLKARQRRRLPENLPALDRERYQTVFAARDGAVAAPTAGLHFTEELLSDLRASGVLVRPLTLLVGPGTFRPVKTERIEDHVLDPEFYDLPAETAEAVAGALREGRRVVATGTTCCRVLEHVARTGEWRAHSGWTDLYIYPPFEFKVVGALITNFHLPRSTLLMLACAFAGREQVLSAYAEAISQRYRFYSYGDAMFIA